MIFVDGVCVSVMRTPLCSGYPSLLPCPDPEMEPGISARSRGLSPLYLQARYP